MVTLNIEPGEVYHCLSNEKTYVVLALGKMKHPDSCEWLEAVTYRSTEQDDPAIYTRALSSFRSGFVALPRD